MRTHTHRKKKRDRKMSKRNPLVFGSHITHSTRTIKDKFKEKSVVSCFNTDFSSSIHQQRFRTGTRTTTADLCV